MSGFVDIMEKNLKSPPDKTLIFKSLKSKQEEMNKVGGSPYMKAILSKRNIEKQDETLVRLWIETMAFNKAENIFSNGNITSNSVNTPLQYNIRSLSDGKRKTGILSIPLTCPNAEYSPFMD